MVVLIRQVSGRAAAVLASGSHGLIALVLIALLVGGCNKSWSPEDDRSVYKSTYATTPDGYYRVRRGDTLHAIAFNFGLDWREIAKWNGIAAPYTIYPDQELRLEAPKRSSYTQGARVPAPARTTDVKTSPAPAQQPPKTESKPVAASQTVASPKPPPATRPSTSSATSDPTRWRWPVEGRILSNFKANDPARNGIEIAGKEGQAIVATAPGEVVYSGNGLIGYGELIIIKHSDRMLSAYAHNRRRLVAEGQAVSAGEKIAEMGRDERNRVLLHFEIRRNGTPQDPLRYLPGK